MLYFGLVEYLQYMSTIVPEINGALEARRCCPHIDANTKEYLQ